MINQKASAFLAAVCLMASFSLKAAPITYYDIDFSAPTHTIGSAPRTGSTPDTVTSINFGNPSVQSSFGALDGAALVFNTLGNTTPCCYYDQISLRMGQGSTRYQFSFDLVSRNFVSSPARNDFAILFDTPQVRNLYFNNNGTVSVFNPSGSSFSSVIGSFNDNQLLSVMVDIDLILGTWDIFMNGTQLLSDFFRPSGDDIESVRFSFGNFYTTTFDSIGIDNILITNGERVEPVMVAEPSSALLIAVSLFSLMSLRKRKYNN